MKTFRQPLSILAVAVSAVLPLSVPTFVHSQTTTTATSAASISSFKVQQVRSITPGSELSFTVNATPGSAVTLQLAGATADLPLAEVSRGVYEGTYTVRSRDKLTAASAVTARVVKDGKTTTAPLDRSLVVGAAPPVAPAYITAFNVTAPERVRPGDELTFSVTGAPGAQARVNLQGSAQPIALTEVRRGVYEGSYVVRRQENLPRDSVVASAYLTKDKTEVSQRFERVATTARGTTTATACVNCGQIESVNKVQVKDGDSNNVLGTVAGGVIGGVVGNQIGGGRGKDIARIAGAIGGAYAGNRIQNSRNKDEVFRVAVRMSNGTVQSFDYANDPEVAIGTQVRVEDGVLIRA